jgi:hypothetical protein
VLYTVCTAPGPCEVTVVVILKHQCKKIARHLRWPSVLTVSPGRVLNTVL